MAHKKYKIYSDGSNYIGIEILPKLQQRRHLTEEEIKWKQLANAPPSPAEIKPPTEKHESVKVQFERLYRENNGLRKKALKQKVIEELLPKFNGDLDKTQTYVEENAERLKRNKVVRLVRLERKIHLQQWTHFVTVTYDDSKHTEETFRKQLLTCLRHLAHRKGWKYVGVFERSPKMQRLHFHGIFYIPEMIGTIIETKDYNTKDHKMQIAHQNTHFLKRFGRNDFAELIPQEIDRSVAYLMKYINKTGEKIIYSRNLPTYFVSEVDDDEILCPIGIDDRKTLFFPHFDCYHKGEYVGEVSPETIAKLPKCNN